MPAGQVRRPSSCCHSERRTVSKFISEEIEVRFGRKPGPPVSFVWRGIEHRVAEVRSMRRVLDVRSPWWQRRHRDYYQVKTDAGDVFEIYLHRGPGKRYWVLYRKVDEPPVGR
jgi:hypothetical protein